jgi:hypothetical protein
MPQPFSWEARRFADVYELSAHLAKTPVPQWLHAWTLHHTWKPVPSAWRGLESMKALERYYRDEVVWYDDQGRMRKGWWSAPHLFVCIGSPDPAKWDGIYQGTPLTHQGTHAGACNGISGGVEVVWNGDLMPWSPQLENFLLDIFEVLCDWSQIRSVNTSNFRGHRECGSDKTCPGSKNDMGRFRSLLNGRLAVPNEPSDPLKVKQIQGATRKYFCGTGFYNYWSQLSSGQRIWDYGFPKTDETPSVDLGGRPCTYMVFERKVLKYVEGEGVRPALLDEAMDKEWI